MKFKTKQKEHMIPYLNQELKDQLYMIDRINNDRPFLEEILAAKNEFIKERQSRVPKILRIFKMHKYAARISARGFNDGLWCFTNQLDIDPLFPPEPASNGSKYSEKGQTKKAAFTMFKVSLAATTILGVIVGLIATSIFFGSSSLTLLKGAMIGLGSGVVAGAAIGGSVGLKTYISYRNQFASAGFGAGKKAAKDGIEKTRELLKGVQKEVMTEHGMSDNVEIVGSKDKEKKEEPVEKREKLSANIANKEKAEKNVKENAANDANNKDSSSANDGNKEAEVDSDGFSSTRRPIYNAPYAIPAYTHPVGMSYSRYPAMHMNSGIMPTVGHMPYSYMNQYPLAGGVPLVGGVNYPSQVITPFYPYSHNLDGPVTHNLNIVRETGFGNNWRDKVKNQLNNSMTHGSNAYAQQHISY